MSIQLNIYPNPVCVDASALIVVQTSPNVTVSFSLTGGGSISNASSSTNDAGIAYATYTPATIGETVTITAVCGA